MATLRSCAVIGLLRPLRSRRIWLDGLRYVVSNLLALPRESSPANTAQQRTDCQQGSNGLSKV